MTYFKNNNSTTIFALHAAQHVGSSPPAAPSGPSSTGGGRMTYFPASVQPQGSIVANATLNFSTNTPDGTPADAGILPPEVSDSTSGGANAPPTSKLPTASAGGDEVVATPEVLCPCGLRPPFDSRGPCCSMTCHKKYVTDVETNQTDSSLLDEITRRLQVTMTYQHTLVCSLAAHQAANDGSEFIPPAPPRL